MEARGCGSAKQTPEHIAPLRRAPRHTLEEGAEYVDRGRSREVARGVAGVASGAGEKLAEARLHENGGRARADRAGDRAPPAANEIARQSRTMRESSEAEAVKDGSVNRLDRRGTSASPRKRTSRRASGDVRFVPKGDICTAAKWRFYSITSSAVICIINGSVSPSAFAVLRLMINSNLVGACTGRSPGLSPLRMRST